MTSKLMTTLWTALIVTFGWTAYAHACSPAPSCTVIPSSSEGSPSCLTFESAQNGWGDASECSWHLPVKNQCDEAVEFVELDCGDDCLAPQVIEARSYGSIDVRSASTDESVEQSFGWSLGEATGVVEITASHNTRDPDATCPDSDLGCQQTPSAPAPRALPLAVLLGTLLVGLCWRRRAHPKV